MSDNTEETVAAVRSRVKVWGIMAVVVALGAALAVVVVQRGSRQDDAEPVLPVKRGVLSGWNVLLVSIDTLRADHVGCYGYRDAATPTLDSLAGEGVRFEQAITVSPITLTAHSSLMTGMYPHHHGARANGLFRLGDDARTLAEVLSSHGYNTHAVVSAYVLDGRYGLAQGFAGYSDDLSGGNKASKHGFREIRADRVTEKASELLRAKTDAPFFMFVHYFDPHAQYEPPEPYRTQFAKAPYDGEIAFVDEQLGRLLKVLDELDAAKRTLVVVVSDHGESLGEHGEVTHMLMIYDATMRVPWIMRAPGVIASGSVVPRQVGLIDVMPTVLDLLGCDLPDGLDGVSLLRTPADQPGELYIETLAPKVQFGWAALMGIRRDDVKFILAPRPELYDLAADPNELVNVISDRRELAQELHERLRGILGEDPELASRVSGNLQLDAASREKLKGLGYVFQTGGGATSRRDLPDPKDMMADWRQVQVALTLANHGNHDGAVAILSALLVNRPRNWRAWQAIGLSYKALGKWDLAAEAFGREAECPHRWAEATTRLANAHLKMGRVDQAEATYQRVLDDNPRMAKALYGMGGVRAKQKRNKEALRLYRECLEYGAGDDAALAWFNIGVLHHAAGRDDEARQAFKRSLGENPGFGAAARALAELMRQSGQKKEAVRVLEQANSHHPEAKTLAALGGLQAEQGEHDAAIGTLRESLKLAPTSTWAQRRLVAVLQERGQNEEAIQQLTEWVRVDASSAEARLRLGAMLAGLKRYDEAEAHLRQAVKLAPKWSQGHYNLGVILAKQDKLDEAAKSFRHAIEIKPRYAGAHNALGQTLMSRGKRRQAAEHFRKALAINPKLDAARAKLRQCTSAPTTSRP